MPIVPRGLLALAALALVAAAPPARHAPAHVAPGPAAHPAARDWTRVATRLPSGTFLLGNPQAKVKLVEYLSLTCPHCAHMAAVAIPPLEREYVRTGRVSYEVRPAMRDPVDIVAMVLSRCAGPRAFFATLPPLYAAQEDWLTKGYAYLQGAPPADGKTNGQQMTAVAKAAGFDSFFAAHGLAPSRQAACLAADKDPALLARMAEQIWKPGFPGTPTFEINGNRQGVLGSWEELRAKLIAAGA